MKLAIFDMDGTILDSMGLWLNAGELYLKTLGITAEKDLGKKLFELNMEEGAEYMKEKYQLPFSVPELCDGINKVLSDAYENSLKLKPGAFEFLTMLKKKGIKTALCTNTSDQLFEKAFDRLKINGLFDFKMYTGKFNFSKSNPDVFFYISGLFDARPDETWVFEDALYAVKTAANAGFNTAGIFDFSGSVCMEEMKQICTKYFLNFGEASDFFA